MWYTLSFRHYASYGETSFHGVYTLAGEIDTKYMNKKYLILSVVKGPEGNEQTCFKFRHWESAQKSLNYDLGLIPGLAARVQAQFYSQFKRLA